MIGQTIRRCPLPVKIALAGILIVLGSVAAYGWFTDKKIHIVEGSIAQIHIDIDKDSDTWIYPVENGAVSANGSFVLRNGSERETYMRVGVIPTWLDEAGNPIMAECDAGSVIQNIKILPADLGVDFALYNAEMNINGISYKQKKTFIKLVEAGKADYAKVPPAPAIDNSLRITCSFNVKAGMGIPDNAKYLRLSFVPEAIQATDSALAYVQDTGSGLNAPW